MCTFSKKQKRKRMSSRDQRGEEKPRAEVRACHTRRKRLMKIQACCLMTERCSEKPVVRRIRQCANATEGTYTGQGGTARYTTRLRCVLWPGAPGYTPLQRVTLLNTRGSWNTMVSVCVSKHVST